MWAEVSGLSSWQEVLGPGRVKRRGCRQSRRAGQGNQVARDSRESCEGSARRSEQ